MPLKVDFMLGKLMLWIRNQLDMSQAEMVDEFGLNQSHVSLVESGLTPPPWGYYKVLDVLYQRAFPGKETIPARELFMIECMDRDRAVDHLFKDYCSRSTCPSIYHKAVSITIEPADGSIVVGFEGNSTKGLTFKPSLQKHSFNSLETFIKFLI